VNKAFLSTTGFKPKQVLNKLTIDVIPEPSLSLVHQHYKKAIETGQTVSWIETTPYNGKLKTGLVSVTPIISKEGVVTYLIGNVHDISELVNSNKQIKQLSLIVSETINGAIITDKEGRITWVNKAFENITGFLLEEVKGKRPKDFLQGEKSTEHPKRVMHEAIKQQKPFKVEIINYHKNGDDYWVKIEGQPIFDEAGNLEGFFALQTDITQEKNYLIEKELLIQELTDANNDLRQFAYITTHNLRAPLTNLVSIANLIQPNTDVDEETLELIEGFKKSTYQLNETLDDLIKIIMIKDSTNIEQYDLKFEPFFQKVCAILSQLIKQNEVVFQVDFSGAEGVRFSDVYMESIFLNLLSNSIKYRDPERQLIVGIKSSVHQNHVQLEFSDNGLGF